MSRCHRLLLEAESGETTGVLIDYVNDYLDGRSVVVLNLLIQPYPLPTQRSILFANAQIPFGGVLPSLRSVSLENMFVLWSHRSNIFSSLTHVRLENLYGDFLPTCGELFGFFKSTRQLTHLHMLNVECSNTYDACEDTPVLPQLTHLYFSATNSAAVALLASLKIPALQTILVELYDDDIVDEFFVDSPALLNMLCSVTTAIFTIMADHILTFINIFRALPNVVNIDARGNPGLMVSAFHAILLHSPVSLTKIELYICDDVLPDFMLQPMVAKYQVTIPYQSYVDKKEDKFMHINAMPYEMLCEMFDIHLEDVRGDAIHITLRRYTILGVCRLWRTIGSTHCKMWKEIHIDNRIPLDMVRTAMQLVNATPLSIEIILPGAVHWPGNVTQQHIENHILDVLQIFGPVWSRCRRLLIVTESHANTWFLIPRLEPLSVPLLEFVRLELEVDEVELETQSQVFPPLFRGILPYLRSLTFGTTFFIWPDPSFYCNLRHVSFTHFWTPLAISRQDVYTFLAATPRLEYLELYNISGSRWPPPTSPAPTLLHLTHLKIKNFDENIAILLSTLSLPKFHTLLFEATNDRYFNGFSRYCPVLLSRAMSVSISGLVSSLQGLDRLLSCTYNALRIDLRELLWINLRLLTGDEPEPGDDLDSMGDALFEIIARHGRLCPNLTSIVLPSEDTVNALLHELGDATLRVNANQPWFHDAA
ncbi:hypothetical protein DFH07DRAFT_957854 [Mycena maculata]|uniref:F-box domain-containing protein n=1 Tax=Mycena maculata TaxID=230809 RepID=A0AAD7NGW0_9AGAR|nr:hypothetical protein DFH07DRAFT_957854 [Mycena maculata]